jgi:hypothetical protein
VFILIYFSNKYNKNNIIKSTPPSLHSFHSLIFINELLIFFFESAWKLKHTYNTYNIYYEKAIEKNQVMRRSSCLGDLDGNFYEKITKTFVIIGKRVLERASEWKNLYKALWHQEDKNNSFIKF